MLKDTLSRTGYAALRASLRFPDMPLINRFAEQGHLLDLLKNLRINYVLDVGANQGWFAKHLRMMGYDGYIFCFEPIRANCDAISRLAGEDPSWRLFNFALGSENTAQPFNVISLPNGCTGLSSFLQPNIEIKGLTGKAESVKAESVAIKRLDDVLDEVIQDQPAARVFLKMDTQGYDLEVLRGCVKWIDKVSLLQSELSITPIYDNMPHYTQALEHYEALGFSLMNLFVVNRAQHRSILEYDCVMARLDRFDQ
jgi:FkbM family methyltransferase